LAAACGARARLQQDDERVVEGRAPQRPRGQRPREQVVRQTERLAVHAAVGDKRPAPSAVRHRTAFLAVKRRAVLLATRAASTPTTRLTAAQAPPQAAQDWDCAGRPDVCKGQPGTPQSRQPRAPLAGLYSLVKRQLRPAGRAPGPGLEGGNAGEPGRRAAFKAVAGERQVPQGGGVRRGRKRVRERLKRARQLVVLRAGAGKAIHVRFCHSHAVGYSYVVSCGRPYLLARPPCAWRMRGRAPGVRSATERERGLEA